MLVYGGLNLVISLLFSWIAKTIIHEKYPDKNDMRKVYNVIYGDSYLESGLLYLGIMVLGYFWPRVALVRYIIMPIHSFISDSARAWRNGWGGENGRTGGTMAYWKCRTVTSSNSNVYC